MKLQFTLLILLLNLTSTGIAQQKMDKVLTVGDSAPPLNVYKWLKGTPVNRLEKGRAYVIEFGATWCAPCAAAIPKLTALSNQYADELTVVSVFVMERNVGPKSGKLDYVSNVESYVSKRSDKINYSVAVDGPERTMETQWLQASRNIGVPFTFVIDKQGLIASISSDMSQVNEIVTKVLSSDYKIQKTQTLSSNKSDKLPFDNTKLLLIEGNGGDESDFAFRSLIQKYDGKIVAANPDHVNSYRDRTNAPYMSDRLQFIGVPLRDLYYMAYADTLSSIVFSRNYLYQYPDTINNPNNKRSYGKYWHAPVLEVADKSPFIANYKSPANRYNYSLKVPSQLGTAKFLQEVMQRDMKNYFGYEVCVEIRQMPYWKVVKSGNIGGLVNLKSKEKGAFRMLSKEDPYYFYNAQIRDIIWTLGSYYGYPPFDYGKMPKEDQGAFVDETGIDYDVDFKFDQKWSFEECRAYLNTIGLDIVKSTKPMKVVVIQDPGL